MKKTVLKAVASKKKEKPRFFVYGLDQLSEVNQLLSQAACIADVLANVSDGTALKGGTVIGLGEMLSENLGKINGVLKLIEVQGSQAERKV